MANSYLIDLGINDSTQDIARKCNANFRKMSYDLSRSASAAVRREGERTDAVIAGATSTIEDALKNALDALNDRIKDAEDLLDAKIEEIKKLTDPKLYAPGIGTYIYSTTDPGTTWPGTKWERVAEGNYLISAGSSVVSGQSYGANSRTLTEANMPSHSHGAGTLKASSAGAHTHNYGGQTIPLKWGTRDQLNDANKNYGMHNFSTISSTTTTNGGAWGDRFTDRTIAASAGSHEHSITGSTDSKGSGTAFDNRPQSIAVPLWKRTA